jgi:Ca2+-binding RTX toxin-like protein
LKRLILLFTVATMLATLGIGTAAYAKGGGPSGPGENYNCPPNCDGTPNDDTITGDDNHNEIRAQGGRDTVYGKGGDDDLYGNGGPDTIYGGTGNDNLYGGGGNDILRDQKGPSTGDPEDIDNLYGGDGNDYLDAYDSDPRDLLDGGADTDTCDGDPGDNYQSCETINRLVPPQLPTR